MPIPIKLKEITDYSFLLNYVEKNERKIIASNKDAELLYSIWESCEKDGETYKIKHEINSIDISRLRNQGLISGNSNEVQITKKGRNVITTMALGEPNRFEKKRVKKNYNEILASMDKKGKKGFRSTK